MRRSKIALKRNLDNINSIENLEIRQSRATRWFILAEQPLTKLIEHSKEFKEFAKEEFPNLHEMTVWDAVQTTAFKKLIQFGDAKLLQAITQEMYGKVKEKKDGLNISLPVMQDPADIINQLDVNTLKQLLKQKESEEANKNDNDTDFKMIE